MEITRIRMLRGPNLWSRHTALEAIVSCDEFERSIDSIPQFETKIRERFPQLGSMRRGGHNEILSLAHALEHAALGLQSQAGCPVTFSRTVQTIEVGVYQVVVEYTEEVVGRMAFDFAFALIQSTLSDVPFDLAAALSELEALYEDVRLGPSTGSIVDAAVQRNPPRAASSYLHAHVRAAQSHLHAQTERYASQGERAGLREKELSKY